MILICNICKLLPWQPYLKTQQIHCHVIHCNPVDAILQTLRACRCTCRLLAPAAITCSYIQKKIPVGY